MKNKALLVGINHYDMPGSDLRGCVSDVTNVRDVLLKFFGFEVGDVTILTDARATKKRIMEKLEKLAGGAKKGDRLVFHYSGHGSQVRDVNGDELKDRMDEILCPHDMDWDGTWIADDDLGAVLGSVASGVRAEVILDSCHSGTGTREMTAIGALPPELGFRPRFLVPPADIASRTDEDLATRKLLRSGNPARHVLWAACRENQTSADASIGGSWNGAFTYYLCKHLRDAQGVLPRKELLRRTRASLKFNGFGQVPQLEATAAEKGKELLG